MPRYFVEQILLKRTPKICATICATSVTAYWWVPGMFIGDKRVIGLPKSNTNDHAFAPNVTRNTVCHLPIVFAIKQQFEAQV